VHRELAASALKDTIRAHRATKRWLDWCDGLNAAMKAAGVYAPTVYPVELAVSVERAYIEANKKPRMPSKDHKHRMYASAYRAADLSDVSAGPGSINDMAGIARVIAEVTAALAAV
jgi:hypothetical protein